MGNRPTEGTRRPERPRDPPHLERSRSSAKGIFAQARRDAGPPERGATEREDLHVIARFFEGADLGFDEMKKHVVRPHEGVKIAGYVGCQTNRPFGVDGESFENPQYLDKMVEMVGAESIPEYDMKVTCCGGALAFSEPEKAQAQIKDIVESAYDHGAEMIVTPCPLSPCEK